MLILAAATLAFGGCKKPDPSGPAARAAAPAAVKLALVTAKLAPTPTQLVLTGLVKADQRSEVTADTQGKVMGVFVDRGQRVKMNDPLVRLDVRTASLSAQEARANLGSARAQRQNADAECKRTAQLLEQGAITRSEYDRQMTACSSALGQVQAAEARTAMFAKGIADGVVRAPFAGMIGERTVEPGEWVAPGRALFVLVDDDPLRIELAVPEAAVGSVAVGQAAMLRSVAFPNLTFAAKVTRVGAEVGRTRALIIEATIEPGSKLVPGMFAEATLSIGSEPKPTLPAAAVVLRGKQQHAFVVIDGEVQDRIVQVGPAPGEGQVSILQGVAAGDQVVATVTEQVVDGLRVAP